MSNYKYAPVHKTDYNSYFTYTGSNRKQHKGLAIYTEKHNISETVSSPKQNCGDCICTSLVIFFVHLLFVATFPFSALFTLKLVRQYERYIVYRLGRLRPVKGPGIVMVLPCIDRWQKVDLRMKAFNIPPSKVCTSDGCIISIGAIIQFRIEDPLLMCLSIQDVDHGMRDSAMSDMTNLLSKKSFHDIKSKRQSLAYDLQTDINQSCQEWGIEVSRVELSDVSLLMAPQSQPSSFMPMHGAAPPPQMDMDTGINGLAQLAQQFFTRSTDTSSKDAPALKMSKVIDQLNTVMCPELLKDVNASYEFHITDCGTYFLDLRLPPGIAGEGKLPTGDPDVQISLSSEVLQQLLDNSLSPTRAYAFGKLTVNGNVVIAKKLDKVFERL